ncbi:hypothetical protein KCU93_g10411, partial [Aureobasidium melanogenum]
MVTPSTQNVVIYSSNPSTLAVFSPSSLSAQNTPIYSPNLADTQTVANISPYVNASHQNTPSPPQSLFDLFCPSFGSVSVQLEKRPLLRFWEVHQAGFVGEPSSS